MGDSMVACSRWLPPLARGQRKRDTRAEQLSGSEGGRLVPGAGGHTASRWLLVNRWIHEAPCPSLWEHSGKR